MPRKPTPRDDPEQSKRFIDAAKEAGAAEPGEFERAFKKVASREVGGKKGPSSS
jgi:hypothetical protein